MAYPSLVLSLLLITLATSTSGRIISAGARNLFEMNLPELPIPELPDVTELPEPELPSMPKVEIPNFPELNFPTVGLPEFPHLPSFPQFPEFTKPGGVPAIHKDTTSP